MNHYNFKTIKLFLKKPNTLYKWFTMKNYKNMLKSSIFFVIKCRTSVDASSITSDKIFTNVINFALFNFALRRAHRERRQWKSPAQHYPPIASLQRLQKKYTHTRQKTQEEAKKARASVQLEKNAREAARFKARRKIPRALVSILAR